VKIYNSVFLRNTALSQGGALHLGGENSEFIISNSNFTNNSCNNTESRRFGGAIYSGTFGTLYINECDFTNNTALNGTAVYNGNGATINITNSNFSYNYGSNGDNEESRGTVMIGSGITSFGNCYFKYNNASYGGAISINSGENVYINSSIFYNNLAYAYGGAICNYGNLLINNSIFSQNNGTQRGGAIHDKGSRTLIITNTTFKNNRVNTNYIENTSGKGGAISLHDTTDGIIISNCTFNHSSAYYGGAIYTDNETDLTINDTIFLNNTAKYGGALYTTTIVEMDILDCVFDSNRAVIKGAAILFNGSGPSVKINNSNFTDNQAYGYKGEGGAIYIMQYIVLRVYGSYFNGNNATLNGGAFCSYSPVHMIITNTTLIYNNANNGGALYHNNTDYTLNSSLIHLKACVIYNNSGSFQIYSVGLYDTFNNYNHINWTWFGQNNVSNNTAHNFNITCSFLLQINSTLDLNSSSWLNDTVNINLNDEIELLIVYGITDQNQINDTTIPIRYADSFMSTLTINIILDDSTSYDLDLYYKLRIDVSDINKIEIILNNQKIILSRF
ncbi:MAG: hypothetical protein LUG89_01445, partial [Methanosphaera sp.]|nr:hypothetical protein [Methanosphaera sp.]